VVGRNHVGLSRYPDQPLQLVGIIRGPVDLWDVREKVHPHASSEELVIKHLPPVRKYLIEAEGSVNPLHRADGGEGFLPAQGPKREMSLGADQGQDLSGRAEVIAVPERQALLQQRPGSGTKLAPKVEPSTVRNTEPGSICRDVVPTAGSLDVATKEKLGVRLI
jgi:hypothetical protein